MYVNSTDVVTALVVCILVNFSFVYYFFYVMLCSHTCGVAYAIRVTVMFRNDGYRANGVIAATPMLLVYDGVTCVGG